MTAPPSKRPHSAIARLRQGAAVQRRVIGALMLRELHTRYGRENIGYVWILAEPLMLAVAISVIHRASGGHSQDEGIHPAGYAAVGYTMFMLVRQILTRADGAIAGNAPLLHHRQVTIFDICTARGLLELVSIILAFIVMVLLCVAVGWSDWPARPEYLFLSFALLFIFAQGLGMAIVALVEVNSLAHRLLHPSTYLLIPASGAFFSISWLSPGAQRYAMAFPFPQYFEMMRYGMFEKASPNYFSIEYAVVCGLFAFLIGITSLKLLARHVHVN